MPPFDDPSILGSDAAVVALHLERAIACLHRGDLGGARAAAAAAAASCEPTPVLEIGDDGRTFTWRGRTTSLVRRARMRRILSALADGKPLTRDALLAVGWPGERMTEQSGALRVYTEISRLRRAGLVDVIVTCDDGYALRGVRVRRV